MRTQHAPRGFTLVELLVVIGIIAILAAILLPVIGKAQDESKRKADQLTIQSLVTALGIYEQDYQSFPPSTLDGVGFTGTNPSNQGAETIVATLSSKKKGGTGYFEFKEDKLVNTDGDNARQTMQQVTGGLNVTDLWELGDEFGSPFVYIHHRDYAKPNKAARYVNEIGLPTDIEPQKSEKTKEWFGAGTFQIWGFGPNGENENGGGDDVVSW